MSRANKFLENIQGILLFLKYKNGENPTLEKLLEIQNSNPQLYDILFDDYQLEHQNILNEFFIERKNRIKNVYEGLLFNVMQEFQYNESNSEFEEALNKVKEYYENLVTNLPTKYQESYSYSIVNSLLNDLIEAATELEYQVSPKPIIGTVSTNSINAGAFTLESGESIIIVQEDFLSFIHLFAKIFTQCLPFEGNVNNSSNLIVKKKEIFKTIDNNPAILDRFIDLVNSSNKESPRNSEQYILPKDSRYQFCTYLMLNAEYFMVGHEIGHLIKHHRNSKCNHYCFNEDCSTTYEKNRVDKEYEADKIGLHLAMRAMANKGFKLDFCFIGIESYFIMHDILLKAKQNKLSGDEDISHGFVSYPSNLLRRRKIRQELSVMINKNEFELAIYLPDLINETMNYLLEKYKKLLYF